MFRNADEYRAEMRRIENEQKRRHDDIMKDYRTKLDKYAKEAEADKKEAKRQIDEMRKHNEVYFSKFEATLRCLF